MNKIKEKLWLKEYEDFLQSGEVDVPQSTQLNTLNLILEKLNPSPFNVFFKIFAIHVVFGYLSLAVCHQFDINPFQTERSLSDWFMKVGGHHFCMLCCGILFVGGSLFAAGLFLTIEETLSLRKTEVLQTLVLGLISLGLFAAFGAEMALGIAFIWLLGGLIGGVLATEVVFRFKRV